MPAAAASKGSVRFSAMPGQLPNPQDPHARHASSPAELVRMNRARERGVPLLSWRDEEGELRILDLDAGERYSIGRGPKMAVALRWDKKVSKLHAELECVSGEWVISDSGLSKNGTRVNGEPVRERTRLRDMDRIHVGTSLLAFHGAVADPAGDGQRLSSTVTQRVAAPVPSFDDVDREILAALCRDFVVDGVPRAVESKRIAAEVHLGVNTIKKRLGRMYARCGIEGRRDAARAELMAFVIEHGIVSPRSYDPRGP